MPTIGEIIRDHARLRPGHAALVAPGVDPLSFLELHREIEAFGIKLRRAGFRRNARIGIALPDGVMAVLAIVAAACEAIAVPLDTMLTAAELAERLAALSLDAVLLPLGGLSALRRVAIQGGTRIIEVAANEAGKLALNLLVADSAAAAPNDDLDADSPALILQTSGTTGWPKLVPITHRNFIAEAAKIQAWFDLTPRDRCLCFTPLCYAHALRQTVFPSLITGGSVARPATYAEVEVRAWLSALAPTWYSAFPIFHRSILQRARGWPDASTMHSLRFILSAGTPLSEDVRKELEDTLAVPVLEFYGIGEAGQMSANLPAPAARKAGTCGIPWPGEVIVADGGRALPAGELGEVLLRGPSVISGYLNNDDANKAAFAEGWFHTGDLGSLDEDGFLTLHGRFKEVINRGGAKIAPSEIDRALLGHPAVAEAAAFAVPHPRLGEDVAAAVVLGPGKTADAAELRTFLRGRLAEFKIPRRLVFVDELPKDVTGKVRRRQLGRSIATGLPGRADAVESPLEAELSELWRRLLKCEHVGVDDDFFERGGDSLLAVEMRLAVEQLIGHALPETILIDTPTIRQLARSVVDRTWRLQQPLVPIQSGGARPPFFFLHGDFASGGYYVRRMGKLLGSDIALTALAPHGLGGEPMPRSIEKMAAERLPLLLAAQPAGPFRLGGYCNGGTIAFEMSRQLRAAGREVELLVMIDSPLSRARRALRGLGGTIDLLASLGISQRAEDGLTTIMTRMWRYSLMLPAERRATVQARLGSTLTHLNNRVLGVNPAQSLAGGEPRPEGAIAQGGSRLSPASTTALLDAKYSRALASYQPRALDIPLFYFSAYYSGDEWRKLSSKPIIINLTGDHYGCITTHLHVLAGHMRTILAQ